MRKIGKYVIALCFFASLCLVWFPIIEISVIKISLFDIMRIILDLNGTSAALPELYDVVQKYMQPFFYLIIIWGILILAAGIICLAMKRKTAYQSGVIFAFIINVLAIGSGYLVIQKLNETQEVFEFFNLTGSISLNIFTLAIWGGLYLTILFCSLYGLHQDKKEFPCGEQQVLMPELFRNNENSREEHQDITSRNVPYSEENPSLQHREQNSSNNMKQSSTSADFFGVLVGTGTQFHDYAYELDEKTEVFFHNVNDYMEVNTSYTDSIASIYFIPDYQEYCCEPFEKCSIYLESGQPLGKNKRYYLPRGTKIYISQKNYSFQLG